MESNEDGDFNISIRFFLYFGQKKALHFHVRPFKNWGYKFNTSISVAMFDYSIPQ